MTYRAPPSTAQAAGAAESGDAKHRVGSHSGAVSGIILAMTLEDFDERVAAAVAKALASQTPRPELLDRRGLAVALDCSIATVARLMADGCPHLRVGDSPRFRMTEVTAWLATRDSR
jgi:hypothetical protein